MSSTTKYLLHVAFAVAAMSFAIACGSTATSFSNCASSPAPVTGESGLSDEKRMSLHATAVAQSACLMQADRREFVRLGLSLDALPRAEILSSTVVETRLHVAAEASDVIVLVRSNGAIVDDDSRTFRLELVVLDSIKGKVGSSLEIRIPGGPQKAGAGQWVLALAPSDLYLANGEMAILLLERSHDGSLTQRPHEAMLVEDGKIVARDDFAFSSTMANIPVDEALTRLREGAR